MRPGAHSVRLATRHSRAARSRRPGRFAVRHSPYGRPPRRLPGVRDAPWCGGGRGLGAPASRSCKTKPKDNDSRDVRAFLDRAAAAGASRGRGRGHRRRRHHRRNRGSHPGRGRRVLALGRRPLHQERPRPDPPAAGGRPRDRDVGAALGERTEGRAGLILIETLRTMTLSTMAELSGREEPVSTAELARLALVLKRIEGTDKLRLAREQAAAKAAKAAAGAGQAPGPGTAQEGPLAGDRRPHRRGRGGVSLSASAPGHIGAGRPVESCGISRYPSQSHLIPANPARKMPRARVLSKSLNGG